MTTEQMVKAEVGKIIDNVEGTIPNTPLPSLTRLYCEKAFTVGMLKGIEASKVAYEEEISNLKTEIWELKREIQILS